MKRLMLTSCAIALTLGIFVSAQGQIQKGKERVLRTQTLMQCVMQPNCAALGKALQGAGPADDKGWNAATQNAELLNENGYTLMADGRCPDAVWAGAAKQLRECSGVVLKALGEKNAESGRAAFGEMTKACKACHDVHRKKS